VPQLGASLVDAGLFRRLLELEVRKAQRLRYCLCVVRLKGRIPVQFEAPAWLPQISPAVSARPISPWRTAPMMSPFC